MDRVLGLPGEADSEMGALQGPRYSMAYFANVRYSTVLQGPKMKYPGLAPCWILPVDQLSC